MASLGQDWWLSQWCHWGVAQECDTGDTARMGHVTTGTRVGAPLWCHFKVELKCDWQHCWHAVRRDCPVVLTVYSVSHPTGTALRHCDEHKGWLPPNLFNCSALAFAAIRPWVSWGNTSGGHVTLPLGLP